MRKISFAKGHGTGNDFVIVRDRHNTIGLSPEDVRVLTDRHFGIGADGVLRAVKAEHVPEWSGDPGLWFMDYRNADGSVAEMCGNGLRVFVRYLMDADLLNQPRIATRAGERWVKVNNDGSITVEMGLAVVGDRVEVSLEGQSWPATAVNVGNPHAVVLLDPSTDLAALPVRTPPTWSPAEHFPQGTNVEFVVPTGERSISLRVHERGSGETLSCGTGVIASAAAFASSSGAGLGAYEVRVPGGRLWAHLDEENSSLTGPAVLVAHGETCLPD